MSHPESPSEPTKFAFDSHPDAPPEGERWSTWDGASHGPGPRPAWVITDLGAVDADLGVLKTGKEADVHVVRRRVPARRTDFGKEMISGRWAFAEFETLGALWTEGLPVPYPVQFDGTEILMEFIGADGQAAPRLADSRPAVCALAGAICAEIGATPSRRCSQSR